jgi:hypothetical protein
LHIFNKFNEVFLYNFPGLRQFVRSKVEGRKKKVFFVVVVVTIVTTKKYSIITPTSNQKRSKVL